MSLALYTNLQNNLLDPEDVYCPQVHFFVKDSVLRGKWLYFHYYIDF